MKFNPPKIVLRLLIGAVALFVILFLAISPVAKHLIEKNSEKWIGRKITMEKLFINLFTLNASVTNLKIYESKSDSVFLQVGGIRTGLSLPKLIKGEYYLDPLDISSPRIVIEQKGGRFNYDDLMQRFLSSDSLAQDTVDSGEPIKYSLDSIAISDGVIIYRDHSVKQEVQLQNFFMNCPGVSWNSESYYANTRFSFKSGGEVQASISVDSDSLTYILRPKVDSLNLNMLQPWLNDYVKTSFTGGLLSGQLIVKGDLDLPELIAVNGNVNLDQFRMDDEAKQTLMSWNSLAIDVDSLNVASNIYHFGQISLDKPFILFEMYDKSNNFMQLMKDPETGGEGAPIDDSTNTAVVADYSNPFAIINDYVKEISREYLVSNYTVNDLVIENGHIIYRDFTLEDKFSYDLDNLQLKSGKIDSEADSIHFDMQCLCNGRGKLNAHFSFDPRDYKNMAINYSIEDMRISDFNPYSKFYVAHSFFEGSLYYASNNTIRNGKLVSYNLMNINKIEVSKRIKNKGLYALPLKLAVSLLRDNKGDIKLDIPVEGDLNDPKYKLGKVIWQVLKNIVVKAATAPFSLLSKAFGANEEELKNIQFDYLQKDFDKRQYRSLDLVEKSLVMKPELKVSFVQLANRDSEKELLALFEAKKNYYFDSIVKGRKDTLSVEDYKAVSGIANRDSLFNLWLNRKLLPEDVSLLPSQIKCRKLYGENNMNVQEDSLFSKRNSIITDYLVKQKQIDPNRIIIKTNAPEDSSRFQATPFFAIDFFVDE